MDVSKIKAEALLTVEYDLNLLHGDRWVWRMFTDKLGIDLCGQLTYKHKRSAIRAAERAANAMGLRITQRVYE